MLSPTIAAAAAVAITTTIESRPLWASSEAVISAVSPGTGIPEDSQPTSAARTR